MKEREGASEEAPPLQTFPPVVQEGILLRELLLALSGIEGVYIRVGAEDENGKKLSALKSVTFHIDADSSE
jgi:hypothetical protein